MTTTKNKIPTISYNDINFFNQIYTDYRSDFQNTFQIVGEGTLRCKNMDISKINNFLEKYANFFRMNDILLNNLRLQVMGKSDADLINLNKKKLMIIYGAAFQLYLKSCRYLGKQPDDIYADFVVVNCIVE